MSYRKQGEGGESDFQSCHIIMVTCTVFNNNSNKNTKHANKQKSMTHLKEQNEWTEVIIEGVQISDSLDKDFKTTVLNMFKEVTKNMDKN